MEIKNLSKNFENKVIFNNFSTVIPENKITYIIGPSGSGKTTLLRIMSKLDNSYGGEIIRATDEFSIVFQEPRLFPFLSVKDNILIVKKDINIEKFNEIINLTELNNDLKLMPSELSGGMKMRVALARALYYDAQLIFMDEPFSALDDELKDRMLPKVFNMLKNKTAVIISHNIDEVNTFAENIIDLGNIK